MRLFFNAAICLLFPLALFSQNHKTIEVTYVKAYKNHKDTSDTPPRVMKNLAYQLLCNLNESRFEYIPAMMNDGDKTNQRFIGAGGGKGVYYKNFKEKKKIWHMNKYGEDFLIQEDFNRYKWQLFKNETNKILGYTCYKAVATYSTYIDFLDKTNTITRTKLI